MTFQMDFSRQFLLLVTIWVYSIISDVDAANKSASTCGLSRRFSHVSTSSSMIVGPHRNAKLGDWPWMGAMFHYNSIKNMYTAYCGSSLISDLWVLTAAHCVVPNEETRLAFIRFGMVDNSVQFGDPKHQIDRLVDKIILHPEFIRKRSRNDIALIRLKEPVPFSDYVRPICLARDTQFGDKRYDGAPVYLSGWGLDEFGHASPMLKDAVLRVASRTGCAKQYFLLGARNLIIDKTMTCAGITGSAGCYGDSGGPLMFLNPRDNRLYAMGIVSTAYGCNPGIPNVYTRIAHYMPWILETLHANQY